MGPLGLGEGETISNLGAIVFKSSNGAADNAFPRENECIPQEAPLRGMPK